MRGVALLGAGEPPTAGLDGDLHGSLDVHDDVKLVVPGVGGLGIGGAGGQVGVFAVHPPEAVAATGAGADWVSEKADAPWRLSGSDDVVDAHAGAGLARARWDW